MSKRDYYEVLGVSKQASLEEIKKAYRKKAIENHPDKHKGDAKAEEKFKEINEAYSVLSNQEKRTAYDNFGHQAAGGAGGGGFSFDMGGKNPFGDIFEDAFGGGGESIFENFFGGGGRRSRRARGSDLKYEYALTLEEAYAGKKTEISFNKKASCTECNGSGASPGSEVSECPKCGGTGQLRQNRGIFSINTTCYNCKGEGKVIKSPCYSCKGQGVTYQKKTLKVNIPAGIDEGQSIKIPEEGESVKGGDAGDLYLSIKIKEHDTYEREDNDLYTTLAIKVPQAVLGDKVNFTTISDKTIQIKIAPGTQNDTTLRVKGEGMPQLNSGIRGDLFLKVQVVIPVKPKEAVKRLYQEISDLTADEKTDPGKKKKSFFGF